MLVGEVFGARCLEAHETQVCSQLPSDSSYFVSVIFCVFIMRKTYFLQDHGSINASTVLYKSIYHRSLLLSRLKIFTDLLETVLFAQIRFHDTVSRGRLLNRFGKDFEGKLIPSTATVNIKCSLQASTAICP